MNHDKDWLKKTLDDRGHGTWITVEAYEDVKQIFENGDYDTKRDIAQSMLCCLNEFINFPEGSEDYKRNLMHLVCKVPSAEIDKVVLKLIKDDEAFVKLGDKESLFTCYMFEVILKRCIDKTDVQFWLDFQERHPEWICMAMSCLSRLKAYKESYSLWPYMGGKKNKHMRTVITACIKINHDYRTADTDEDRKLIVAEGRKALLACDPQFQEHMSKYIDNLEKGEQPAQRQLV